MTDRLHLSDSYVRDFEATVTAVEETDAGVAIELYRTAFYAESGGQPADIGTLGAAAVSDVQLVGGRVLHYASDTELTAGQTAAGTIDWARRFDHMQQHTGQHVLSQAFIRTLEAPTVSFHLGREISTIDLEIEALEPGQIYAAEDLANGIVFENRQIVVHEIDSSEQDTLPIRKASTREGAIRVVEVSDFDWSPCGGTHCARTGEIGLIKIRRWERHRGRARVEFVCGGRALADYRRKNRATYQLTKLLSAPDGELVEAAGQMIENLNDADRRLQQQSRRLAALEAERLVERAKSIGNVRVIRHQFEEGSAGDLRELALQIVNGGDDRVVLFGLRAAAPLLLLARSQRLEDIDLREVLTEAAVEIDGRGGGSAHLVHAGGSRSEGLANALDKAETIAESLILKDLSVKDC